MIRHPWRVLAGIIFAGTAVRLAMAGAIGLGIDESYMVAAGRGAWHLGYFDHPPISWWLSNGAARLFGTEAGWAVRLPFIALFAVSSSLMFALTAPAFGTAAGLWAVAAFNLSPVFGVTSGGWVLPDGPLIAALLAAACCLQRALPGRGWAWWLGAGVCAGLALLSKYTAVLTFAGAALFMLATPSRRAWLVRPQPYVAAVLALLVFSPVIAWNAGNGWASLTFQGGRAAAAKFVPWGPLVTLGGEALFVLPWIWLGLMAAWLRAVRAGPGNEAAWLMSWLAAPPIVLFAVVSLWSRQVLFHWAAPGYLFLFPLLGAWLAPRAWALRAAGATAAFLGVAMAFVVLAVRLDWPALPGNPAVQARDWTELRGLDTGGLPLASISWADTGKVAIGAGRTVYCLNADARQFRFSTNPPDSGDVLIVAPRRTLAQMQAAYGGVFEHVEEAGTATAGGKEMPLFRGHGLVAWPSP